jgi:hypothetical protein
VPFSSGTYAIVDRLDRAVGHGDADEHGDERLGHRVGGQAVGRCAVVLVALGQDGVALEDEQSGGAGPCKVVVQPSHGG